MSERDKKDKKKDKLADKASEASASKSSSTPKVKKDKAAKTNDTESKQTETPQQSKKPTKSTINLLVIDSDSKDWYSLFDGVKTSSGQTIVVEKTRWENMMVSSSSNGQCTVNLRPNEVCLFACCHIKVYSLIRIQHPLPNTKEKNPRSFNPDFVLVRKRSYWTHFAFHTLIDTLVARGLSHDENYDNVLMGLMYAGLPAINSLMSVKMCLDVRLNHGFSSWLSLAFCCCCCCCCTETGSLCCTQRNQNKTWRRSLPTDLTILLLPPEQYLECLFFAFPVCL